MSSIERQRHSSALLLLSGTHKTSTVRKLRRTPKKYRPSDPEQFEGACRAFGKLTVCLEEQGA